MIAALTGMMGCATPSTKHQVDEELSKQPNIKTAEQFRIQLGIASQPNSKLTSEQKTQIADLQKRTTDKLDGIRDESWKLRALLVKDLMAAKYDDGKIQDIKFRIKVTEEQRLATIFNAISEANTILGHDDEVRKHFMGEMWLDSRDLQDR
jgi:hypothetical protein